MCRYTCSIMFNVDCSKNESQIEETEKRNAFFLFSHAGQKRVFCSPHTFVKQQSETETATEIIRRSPPDPLPDRFKLQLLQLICVHMLALHVVVQCGDCLCLPIYRSLCEPYQELKLRLSAQCGAAVLVPYQVASFNLLTRTC